MSICIRRLGRRMPQALLACLLLGFVAACGPPVQEPSAVVPASTIASLPEPSASTEPATATLAPAPSATTAPSATVIQVIPTPVPATATVVPATPTVTPTDTEQPTVAAELPPLDAVIAAELQRILDATVADGTIPGAVLAVHIPGQQPWLGASGYADPEQALAMRPDTRVRIASITKMVTAVVVLRLVEEGRIELDAPVATWLPDLVPNGAAISVRQLLNHTTGLYDYLEDRPFRDRAFENPDRIWDPRELVEYAAGFPPAFSPGADDQWDYSSTNYVILGMVVEQVTGNTLAAEMRRLVFEPLGLDQTFAPPVELVEGQQARGYSGTTDQTNAAMSFVFGTANLVSTVGDVQRFARALVAGELLKPEMQSIMNQFVDGKGSYNMPELEYGLGVMRNRLAVGPGPDGQPRSAAASTVLGHIGGFAGFRSAVWSAPENGITIAVGINQAATDPNILATEVFDAILTLRGQ